MSAPVADVSHYNDECNVIKLAVRAWSKGQRRMVTERRQIPCSMRFFEMVQGGKLTARDVRATVKRETEWLRGRLRKSSMN